MSAFGHSCGEPAVMELNSVWRFHIESCRAFEDDDGAVGKRDFHEACDQIQVFSSRKLRAKTKVLAAVPPHAISRRADSGYLVCFLRACGVSDFSQFRFGGA